MNISLAGVFSGQASVFPGMMEDFGEQETKIIRESFQEASDVVSMNLWEISRKRSVIDISSPEVAQLLVLVSGVASFRVWERSGGGIPEIGAGHSIGTISALVASEQISFLTAVKVVLERARLMNEAVPDGATVVFLGGGVTLDFMDEVRRECEEMNGGVDIAVINTDNQFVISGESKQVDFVVKKVVRKGIVAKKLRMGAVHCRRMKKACDKFLEYLQSVTIYENGRMNVDHGDDFTNIRQILADQLRRTEDWRKKVLRLFQQQPRMFVVFGAKDVLPPFIEQILHGRKAQCFCVCDQASLKRALIANSVI